MPTAKIHLLTVMPIGILIVYFTADSCWQFRVLTNEGKVFGLQKLYYTPEAAETAGRRWVGGWKQEL
ncbi:hypothetical protein [Allocoleopsis sp.]|uniref:hypothetical protein n=1 Tax=Allocoleopsis sp. TaxID=3088169 RepID=UPI002FD73D4C